MCDPAVFLETAGLFALPTPMGLFLPSQQPLRQSSKLPALRAVVFAKVRARHLGFLLLRRHALHIPRHAASGRSRPFRGVSSFDRTRCAGLRSNFSCSRTAAQRLVLGFRWARARLCPENRTQPRHAAHAGGQAFFCCACWNASNRFRMRSCSHSASNFASFCS